MEIKIDNYKIGNKHPIFIIAEIGATHGGNLNRALKLIKVAKASGANAVKLQTVNPDYSYTKDSLSYRIFKKLSFSLEDLKKIKAEAIRNKLLIFSTPGDFPSVDLVQKLNFPIIKISSGLMTNTPLIKAIAKLKKPVFISSGMAYLDELAKSIRILKSNGIKKILAFHCTSEYPCKSKNVNLKAIQFLHQTLKLPIGFSDHTRDILAATLSVSHGAVAVEKHLALSNSLAGPERGVACNPHEFSQMVNQIREAEKMLGDGNKNPSKSEMLGRKINRRTLFSIKKIKKGDKFSKTNLGLMRGNIRKGLGMSPDEYENIIKFYASQDIPENAPIKISMIGKLS